VSGAFLIDASALVSIFLNDENSARIEAFLRDAPRTILLSDWAAGEFAATISRYVGMEELDDAHGRLVLATFDAWRPANTVAVATEASDIRVADSFVRRFSLKLRMPDALYLAACQRLGVELVSFDDRQVSAARELGVHVAS
jgi:uncharacterized protein